MSKETSAVMVALASDVLAERVRPTKAQTKSLAACVLTQFQADEERKKPSRRSRKSKPKAKRPSKAVG